MNEEIWYIAYEGKTTKNGWENDDSDFIQPSYIVYIKNHDNSFSILCSLTCLNKDTSFVARYKYFNKLISKV